MSEQEFKDLYNKLIKSQSINQEVAMRILKTILATYYQIRRENNGGN